MYMCNFLFAEHESDDINNHESNTKGTRKLNCNLCQDIFTSILGLNAHMKTHPEVVFFVLQLLDNETNVRNSISDDPSRVRFSNISNHLIFSSHS